MAIVKFGTMVTGIRGTLGGVILSANHSSTYAKQYVSPRNPSTNSQTTQRNRWTPLAENWASLTAAQRTAWDNYANDPAQQLTNSLGQVYFASGWNWFTRIATHRNLLGVGPRLDPPTKPTPSAPTLSTLTITAPGTSGNQVTFPTDEFDPHDAIFFLELTPSVGNKTPSIPDFKLIKTVADPVPSTTVDLGDLQPFFGVLYAGQEAFIRAFKQTDEGRRSSHGQLNTTVV